MAESANWVLPVLATQQTQTVAQSGISPAPPGLSPNLRGPWVGTEGGHRHRHSPAYVSFHTPKSIHADRQGSWLEPKLLLRPS